MKTKIEITQKQAEQFNNMLSTLKKISQEYQKPSQIRKDSQGEWGLDFEEAIEMAYENIQNEASFAIKNVKHLQVNQMNENLSLENFRTNSGIIPEHFAG